ncbi:hypothetical protein KP509_1Z197800 [Ceratopteris richardii]|nr:hypothetical protein KP509_1Z197800 [Ceratopteris richardii]
MCIEREESRTFSVDQGHSEIFRIGTLGVGDLLTRNNEEAERSEDEEEEDEFSVEYEEDGFGGMQEKVQFVQENSEGAEGLGEEGGHRLFRTSSGTDSSMSLRRSTSSSCESEASLDIQKLQEELRQILHFQPVPEKQQAKASRKRSAPIEARNTKPNNFSSDINVVDDANAFAHLSRSRQNSKVDGRNTSSKPSGKAAGQLVGIPARQIFPEMSVDAPMKAIISNSDCQSLSSISMNSNVNHCLSKAHEYSSSLRRKHYSLLMQSIRSKMLHSTAPTHVNTAAPIYESLLKANGGYDLPQRNSTISKVVNICRRVVKRRSNVARKRRKELGSYEQTKPVSWYSLYDEKENPNWAIAKSHGGSERFIDYITNILAQMDNMNDTYPLSCERRSFSHEINRRDDDVQDHINAKRYAKSPISESWIDTDDECKPLFLERGFSFPDVSV